MSAMHGKFIWAELMTPDLAAGTQFYADVVGWKVSDSGMPGMDYRIFSAVAQGTAECQGVGGAMELTGEFTEQGIPPNWTGYIAVDNVDDTVRAFTDAGGSLRRPAQDIPQVGRFAVVADPHGAVLCIMTPLPMDNPPPPVAMETPGHVGWLELYADDGVEAFAFYSKVFGWTKDHAFDMGPNGIYQIFAHNGQPIGGIMTRMPGVPMACWGYYFNVAAIDAAVGRIEAGGGKVINGPMEVPGGSWIINAIDPQGAYFSLVAPQR